MSNLSRDIASDATNDTANKKIKLVAKKRALALQVKTLTECTDTVLNAFPGNELAGIQSLLVGSNHTKNSSRLSVDALQTSTTAYYLGGLIADIQRLKDKDSLKGAHFNLFKGGKLDLEISKALWTIDNPNIEPYKGVKEALDIANVINKWQEKARSEANLVGIWIGKEPGYIVRQSHDASKINVAGFDTWYDNIKENLDFYKTTKGLLNKDSAEAKSFLADVFRDLVTGVNFGVNSRVNSGDLSETTLNNFNASILGSLTSKASEERVLYFNSAEAWHTYNTKYGRGSLRETLIFGLQNSAYNTALMKVLGPSPQANFENIVASVLQVLKNKGDIDGIKKIKDKLKMLSKQLKEVDGSLNNDGIPCLASLDRNVRMTQNMSKLGGVVLTSVTDVPLFSAEMAYQGHSFLGSMGTAIGGLLEGRANLEQQEILSILGVAFDNMNGDLISRAGGGDETLGKMTRLQNLFFKLNGLSWWTDTFKKIAGLMMSHDLAMSKGLDFESLSMEKKKLFKMYGIHEKEWELIRKMETKGADGKDYLTPDALNDLNDKFFVDYLAAEGRNTNMADIDNLRFDMQAKLCTYFRDRIDFAVLSPDAKTPSMTRFDSSSATALGEALRFVMQFKTFMVAYLQKTVGRESYGRGTNSPVEGLKGDNKGDNAEIHGIMQMIITTTLFGYGAMVAKDLAEGKETRDPKNQETWVAAALQGGGLGIFGDFLFSDYKRFEGGSATSLMESTASNLDGLSSIVARVREGDTVAQQAVRFAIKHTLENTISYSRLAMDYLFLYNFYDRVNPDYFRRMEGRVKKEAEGNYFIRPM